MNNKKIPESWNTRKDALIDFNELSEFYDQDVANEKALFSDRIPANFKRTGTLGRGRSVFEQNDSDDEDEADESPVQPISAEYESILREQIRKAVGPGYSNELIHRHFGTNTYHVPSKPAIDETEFLRDVTNTENKSSIGFLCDRVTNSLQVEDAVKNAESDDGSYHNRRMTTDSEYSSNVRGQLKSISEDEIIDYNSFVNRYNENGITINGDTFVVRGSPVKGGDSVTPESDCINSFLNPHSPEFKPLRSRQLELIDFSFENDKHFNVSASDWLPNETKISNDELCDVENSAKKRKGKKKYHNITTEIDFQHIRNLESNEYNKIPIRETFTNPSQSAQNTRKQNSFFDKRLNPSAQSFAYNCVGKKNANAEIPINSKTEFPPL